MKQPHPEPTIPHPGTIENPHSKLPFADQVRARAQPRCFIKSTLIQSRSITGPGKIDHRSGWLDRLSHPRPPQAQGVQVDIQFLVRRAPLLPGSDEERDLRRSAPRTERCLALQIPWANVRSSILSNGQLHPVSHLLPVCRPVQPCSPTGYDIGMDPQSRPDRAPASQPSELNWYCCPATKLTV